MSRFLGLVAACAVLLAAAGARAWDEEDFYRKARGAYTVAAGESVIGHLQPYRVRKGDTLLDIARFYSLGYNEIVEANPGIDPWLPPVGGIVVIPTEWVLPCCERTGVIVNIPEMRLYYMRPSSADRSTTLVTTYAVGLGRDDWRTPEGKFRISGKTENPTWVIPDSIRREHIAERGDHRALIPGGHPDNPLGRHRLELTLPMYRIHGTNIPWGVGMQVSHGCVRLYPEDIERLFAAVPVGTPGAFVYQPVKVGVRGGEVFVETHSDIYGQTPALWREANAMLRRVGVAERIDPDRLMAALQSQNGIPARISGEREPALVTARATGGAER
jgi:L,D-transpeptidase ErfK/SrfK